MRNSTSNGTDLEEIIIDRKDPKLSKIIKEYKDTFCMYHFERYEKDVFPHSDYKRELFLLNVCFHYALLELAIQMAFPLYSNTLEIKSNISERMKIIVNELHKMVQEQENE